MDAEEHRRLLDEVVEQLEDLTRLINDLIDLARGEEPNAHVEEVRLDILVEEVVQKANVRASSTPLLMDLSPSILGGVPARLERAVSNLIDNALKYSPPDEPVEIALHDKELTVRDHGPGIAAEDLPHIFDRFYRGAEARGRPGSGLGLAIVRQVAAQQGGAISAEPAPDGGTLMRLRLPGLEPAPAEHELGDERSGDSPGAAALAGGRPDADQRS
jgi:two-component system sensor histidine kinase MprB